MDDTQEVPPLKMLMNFFMKDTHLDIASIPKYIELFVKILNNLKNMSNTNSNELTSNEKIGLV